MVQIMALVKRVQTENSDGRNKIKVKKVLINDPATIVFWQDGTKTVLMRNEEDEYDAERVIEKAIAIKLSGTSKTKFNNYVKSIVEEHFRKGRLTKLEERALNKAYVKNALYAMLCGEQIVLFETYYEMYKILEIIEEKFEFVTWCDVARSKPTSLTEKEYYEKYSECDCIKYTSIASEFCITERDLLDDEMCVVKAKDLIEAYYG